MKKIKYLTFICLFGLTSISSAAETDPKKEIDTQERMEQLESRINEIWKMDFSDLEKEEKAILKVEVKEIKRELKQVGLDSKVTMSVGLIIIILLLIILLS